MTQNIKKAQLASANKGHYTIWGEAETRILLGHIEEQKGEDSLYLRDPKRAHQEALDLINRDVPGSSLTCKQIATKVFWNGSQVKYESRKDLFLNGICVFRPGYLNFDQGDIDSIETPVRTPIQLTVPDMGQGFSEPSQRRGVKRKADSISPELTPDPASSMHADSPAPSELSPDTRTHPQALVPHGVSLLGGVNSACLEAIERYMLDDPQSFVPNVKVFEQLSSEMADQITRGVRSILRNPTAYRSIIDDTDDTDELQQWSANDYDKPPQLCTSLNSKSFLEICQKIFGGQSIDEVYKKSARSTMRIEDFLVAFVGATIFDWILQGRHRPLPPGLREPNGSSPFETEIREVSLSLHKQASLRSNRRLVNDRIEYEKFVEPLCHRLRDTLLSFLMENDFRTADKDGCCFSETFKSVYLAALRFRGQVLLKEQLCECRYLWPFAGDIFDGGRMATRRRLRNNADLDGKRVALPLLPGLLIRHTRDVTSELKHETAVAATVLLE